MDSQLPGIANYIHLCFARLTFGLPEKENWSAFAPDFKEIEENLEYIEREDEFDDVDEVTQPKNEIKPQDETVDILTCNEDHFGSR